MKDRVFIWYIKQYKVFFQFHISHSYTLLFTNVSDISQNCFTSPQQVWNTLSLCITKSTSLVIYDSFFLRLRLLWEYRGPDASKIISVYIMYFLIYFVECCLPVNIDRQCAVPFNATLWFAFIFSYNIIYFYSFVYLANYC